ncbi:MAG: hypothetical protein KF763_20640 [Cyclobacteriaceae bacterium]|nr:hypothetical protein [Cyclobacteriaceae bacterium]
MKFFVFALLLINLQAFAQPKPLFKIISCSEGVMVDDELVNPGDIIYSNSNKIDIPQTGYLGILSVEGYPHLLTKKARVAVVDERIRVITENERTGVGSIHRPIPNPFKLVGALTNEFNEVYGDSILIAFKCHYNDSPPFKITFVNMFDEIVDEYEVNQTWKVFSTNALFRKETALICQVSTEERTGHIELFPPIKKVRPALKKRIDFDIQRLGGPGKDPASLLALYEINRLTLDHIFQFYKTEASNERLNLDEFLAAYLARTREKYRLEEYMTK